MKTSKLLFSSCWASTVLNPWSRERNTILTLPQRNSSWLLELGTGSVLYFLGYSRTSLVRCRGGWRRPTIVSNGLTPSEKWRAPGQRDWQYVLRALLCPLFLRIPQRKSLLKTHGWNEEWSSMQTYRYYRQGAHWGRERAKWKAPSHSTSTHSLWQTLPV